MKGDNKPLTLGSKSNFYEDIEPFEHHEHLLLRILDACGIAWRGLTRIFPLGRKAFQEPPGPKGHFLLGVIPEFQADELFRFGYRIWSTFGRDEGICQFRVGTQRVIIVTRPDYVSKILNNATLFPRAGTFEVFKPFFGSTIFLTEGEEWKAKSQQIVPHLLPKTLTNYLERVRKIGHAVQADWHEKIRQNACFDLLEEMSRIAMHVIEELILNIPMSQRVPKGVHALNLLNESMLTLIFSGIPYSLASKIPSQSNIAYQSARVAFKQQLSKAVMHYIKCGGGEGNSYLDKRIQANRAMLEKGVLPDELINDIMLMFVGGQETTAKLLTWTVFALTQHPKIAEKLYVEIDTVLRGHAPTMSDLSFKNLPYLSKVLQESLRYYPVAINNFRDVLTPTELGPYRVQPGDSIEIGFFGANQDPKMWEQPQIFNPDRFDNEFSENLSQFSFTPFGAGIHRCPGRHFAFMEAKTILIMLMQQFEFSVENPAAAYPPCVKLTLAPQGVLQFKPRLRDHRLSAPDMVVRKVSPFTSEPIDDFTLEKVLVRQEISQFWRKKLTAPVVALVSSILFYFLLMRGSGLGAFVGISSAFLCGVLVHRVSTLIQNRYQGSKVEQEAYLPRSSFYPKSKLTVSAEDESRIIKIQAIVRGHLTRQKYPLHMLRYQKKINDVIIEKSARAAPTFL